MDAPQEEFYTKDTPDLVADVRDAMSRRGDFGLTPEHYVNDTSIFEVLAALKALTIEDEVLA
jgi:hypothetical protein